MVRGDHKVELLQKSSQQGEEGRCCLGTPGQGSLPKVKWVAVATLLTVKQFSEQSLMSTMMEAWNTSLEVSFQPIGKNLFLI